MSNTVRPLLRALIVDDEPPAQRRLQRLLAVTGRVKVIAMAGSVSEALKSIAPGDIDVAFLDIHMPKEDGFVYVDKVPFDVSIVFVTAYSTFAIRAFEVAALDYLLKPVDPVRLDATLDRVETAARCRSGNEKTEHADAKKLATTKAELICLRLTGGARFVSEKDIICVLACDDYTLVMLKDGSSELVSISMQRWEKKLSSAQFERVHRSAIASITSIQRVHRKGGRWQAWLNGLSDPIPVNRDVARRLRAEGRFEKGVTGR